MDGDGEPLPAGARYRLGSRAWTTGEPIHRLLWNSTGTRLVAVGDGRQSSAWVFHGEYGRLLRQLAFSPGTRMGWAVSPRGQVAVGFWNGTIQVLRDDTGEPFDLEGHPEPLWRSLARDLHDELGMSSPKWCNYVSALAFLPDEERLVSAAGNGRLRLWNLGQGTLLEEAAGHAGSVFNLAVSPDGSLIASGGDDGRVRLWTPELERAGPTYREGNGIMGMRFSADGTRLTVSSSHELSVTVLSVPGLEVVSRWTGRDELAGPYLLSEPPGTIVAPENEGTIREVRLSALGDTASDGDQTTRRWEAVSFEHIPLALDEARGRLAFVSGDSAMNWITVQAPTAARESRSQDSGRLDQISDYALSVDQSRLATLGFNRGVEVVELASGQRESLSTMSFERHVPRWLADGRRLYLYHPWNGWHRVVGISDGEPDPELDPLVRQAAFVDLTWDGRWLTLAVPEPEGRSADFADDADFSEGEIAGSAPTSESATESASETSGSSVEGAPGIPGSTDGLSGDAVATPDSAEDVEPTSAPSSRYTIHVYDALESRWQVTWNLALRSELTRCRPSFDRRKLFVIGGGRPLNFPAATALEGAAPGSPPPGTEPGWLVAHDLGTGEPTGELNLGSLFPHWCELTGDNRWLAILAGVLSRPESNMVSRSLVVVDLESLTIAGQWSLPIPAIESVGPLRWIGQPPRLWVEGFVDSSEERLRSQVARCYEVPSGRMLWELPAALEAGAIVPSSTGDLVAVSRPGPLVELRDGLTGQIVRQFAALASGPDEFRDDGAFTGPLIFSPDDRWLWAADRTGRLHVGEVATGSWVRSSWPHRGPIRRVQPISPELGLITHGVDGTLVVWDWPVEPQPDVPAASEAESANSSSASDRDRPE